MTLPLCNNTNSSDTIRVGISSCLLGEKCRWNGGHKLDSYIKDTLGQYIEFVPCCPESEIGLGIPRETLRLVDRDGEIRLVTTKSGRDHTDKMREYSRGMVEFYASKGICGYILKKDSPSCGMERTKVYNSKGVPERSGTGIYAEALLSRFPFLPVEEEGRLHDPRLRESFLERLFAHRRISLLFTRDWSLGDLVSFHTAEKYLLLAHSPDAYREMGRLVATAKGMSRREIEGRYYELYMTAMQKLVRRGRHVNVINHMVGYLRDKITASARHELQVTIDDYSNGLVPLVVPITLIRHYAIVHEVAYLRLQHYLEPSPKELALRNYT